MNRYRRSAIFILVLCLTAAYTLARPTTHTLGWSLAQQIVSTDFDAINPSAVVDSQGNTHVIWLQNTNGNETEDLFYTSGNGATWQTPINISNSPERSFNAQLAITADDRLVAVWVELELLLGFPIGSRIYYADFTPNNGTGGGVWSSPRSLSDEFLSVGPPFMAMHNGQIHVVWGSGELITGYADRIYHAVWGDSGWNAPQRLPISTGYLDIADIAFDANGQLHMVWNGNRTSSGDVHNDYQIYYTTLQNGAWTTPVNISNTAQYSFFPSLAADINGRIHVIWLEHDLGDFGQGAHIFDRVL